MLVPNLGEMYPWLNVYGPIMLVQSKVAGWDPELNGGLVRWENQPEIWDVLLWLLVYKPIS